jgi:hypothetical protein
MSLMSIQFVNNMGYQCAHPLNVAVLSFCIWLNDGSNEPKHVAEFFILIIIIGCLLTE